MTVRRLWPERAPGRLTTWILAVLILVPALLGFGNKFLEFLSLVGDADGAFTLMPILNYLFVSVGFLCLFCYAIVHGMFRDIERPKYAMLATEQKLEAESAARAEAEHALDEAKEWWQE